MSELDNETVEDTPEVDIEETETEDSSSDSTDITYEQAMEWKKKADRLEKAEKTLVDHKRKLKELESNPNNEDAPMTKFDFEIEKFIEKNPEMADFRNELTKYAKVNKLTLAQAKIQIESDDKTIKNRQKISQSRVSDGETPEKSSYTKEQLAKMDRRAYNYAMDRIDAGKATYIK